MCTHLGVLRATVFLRETDAVNVSMSEHPTVQPLKVSVTVAGSGCVHWLFLGLGPNQCVSGVWLSAPLPPGDRLRAPGLSTLMATMSHHL